MKYAAAALAALALSTGANAATTVDVSGSTNSSLDGSNGVSVELGAGTYVLTFIQQQFTAFNRWSSSDGCNASGASCSQGFENSVNYIIGGVTYNFGDGQGGYGPLPSGGYFDTAANSLTHSSTYTTQFTLADAGSVKFFIYDDYIGDNQGGVSLSISPLAAAVPEPATWAMMILGFGLVGGALRRRRSTVALAAA